ncbi:MAG: TIGR03905 family TSCPD domain-containing protein, partial [Oscillospiraceae bacterium]
MTVSYKPHGVCSRQMTISAENGVITEANIVGGCHGNLQGISRLVTGMKLSDAIEKLQGISCGGKSTSCPDQLTIGMREL